MSYGANLSDAYRQMGKALNGPPNWVASARARARVMGS